MTFAFYTNSVSPHQLPFADSLTALIGRDNYKYIYTDAVTEERRSMGWGGDIDSVWCEQGDSTNKSLLEADVVVSGLRAVDLFEKRIKHGKLTYYSSERWFKPPLGFMRLFVPAYFKMAKRLVDTLESSYMSLLPIGIHAARDMLRLIGLLRGDVLSFFRAPKVAFESRPGGVIVSLKDAVKSGVLSRKEILFGKKYGFVQIPQKNWGKVTPQGIFAKMRLWGYFVEPSKMARPLVTEKRTPKVLWVGRMLNWKRVEDLVNACGENIKLSIYGDGPTKENVKKLAKDKSNISINGFVPIAEIRHLMRDNDIYVLSSNGYEGWGAVVSEALEEGMKVVGTVEAGSTATILPPTHLYKAGDIKRLKELLSCDIDAIPIGQWSAENAANALMRMVS